MKLTDMSYAHEVMERHGIAPKKKFGQNFLTSDAVVCRIADTPSEDKEVGVLEIGPGIGTLTEALADRYKKVVSVEIDESLLPVLADTVGWRDNVTVVNADAMKLDLPEFVKEHFGDMKVCVCANLPYYITSPIIMKILECGPLFESVTVMIQKEVALRLASAPGSADYGAITLFASYLADVKKCFDVSPGNFLPQPKVTSAVIRMKPHKKPPVDVKDPENMQKIIKAAFEQRRKMLAGALAAATSKVSKAVISEKIAAAGLPADVRGEKLSLADFARLSDLLEI
ncbi:MAG: 16S rRNA (adenine(1518)-N(6)/adenine(1519)-N(6))-dimethyltransferase RsmA [Clostridia bacterium]|nr:16S rRNA (adenine(1518)-N(6)/adenine(1519)-N(6))-dimethyltransferase RsmA [Clostridia bacterium]